MSVSRVLCALGAWAHCVRVGNVPGPEQQAPGRHGRFVGACTPKVSSHWLGLSGVEICVRCRVLAPSGTGASSGGPAPLQACSRRPPPERVGARGVGASGRGACGGRGEGKQASPWRAGGPAPASQPAHLGSAAHLLGRRGVSGGRVLAGQAEPGGAGLRAGGRRLIPGIPRASALASAAESAWRAPPACACGRAAGESVRERGRERACASARPRSAPRALGGPASTPAPAPHGARPARGGRAQSRPAVSAGEPGPRGDSRVG